MLLRVEREVHQMLEPSIKSLYESREQEAPEELAYIRSLMTLNAKHILF